MNIQSLPPSAVGFDGDKGITLNLSGEPATYKLPAGIIAPPEDLDFSNQFVWLAPPNKEPQLLYCNDLKQWYRVSFHPIAFH